MNCMSSTSEYDAYGQTGATLNLPPLCFSLSRALTVGFWGDEGGDFYQTKQLREDVAQWCEECIGPVRFEYTEVNVHLGADRGSSTLMEWGEFHRLLHFACDADMVAFKLRWE